jgi:hypothetical protein
MLEQTSTVKAPWTLVDANNKKLTHLNVIRDLLSKIHYPDKNKKILQTDPQIIRLCPPYPKKITKLAK